MSWLVNTNPVPRLRITPSTTARRCVGTPLLECEQVDVEDVGHGDARLYEPVEVGVTRHGVRQQARPRRGRVVHYWASSLSSASISSSKTRCSAAFSDADEPRGVDTVAHQLLRRLGRVLVLTDEVDVFLADVGAEHRGVVGVQVHEQAGLHHRVDRMRREIGPAVHHRGRGRAAREVDPVLAAPLDHRVVFEDVVAVIDALAAEQVEARRDVLGRPVLRRVTREVQTRLRPRGGSTRRTSPADRAPRPRPCRARSARRAGSRGPLRSSATPSPASPGDRRRRSAGTGRRGRAPRRGSRRSTRR